MVYGSIYTSVYNNLYYIHICFYLNAQFWCRYQNRQSDQA